MDFVSRTSYYERESDAKVGTAIMAFGIVLVAIPGFCSLPFGLPRFLALGLSSAPI
jgi:hypothetical protein